MQYRVFFTLPEGGEGSTDYIAPESSMVTAGTRAVLRRRYIWSEAHPELKIRVKWFKILMIMEVQSGKIVYPASGR